MDFFITWTRTDAIFPDYFKDCNILVSPHTVALDYHIGKWQKQPEKLMVDSSAFFYIFNNVALPPQKEIFKHQLRIIKGANCKIMLTHLDRPINHKSFNSINVYNAIEKTLGNAYEFLELINRHHLYDNYDFQPIGVIQGNDKLSLQYCANELKKIGFKKFGLGSLAVLFNPNEIMKRIKWACDIVGGENLHVFGISRLDIIEELIRVNIMSLDSTRPIKAAIYNGIFYSNPFRTFGITMAQNASSYGKTISETLPCDCPVCSINPDAILVTGNKKSINDRAVHNYYHLIKHLLG